MGNLKACFIVATLALAACGSDKAKPDAPVVLIDAPVDSAPDAPPDGPSFDFSCMTNPAPTTASATITIAGTVAEVTGSIQNPMIAMSAGATVNACTGNCQGQNNLDMQTSAADGTWTTVAIPTNSMPLDGYLHATKTGDRDSYVFPATPLTADMPVTPVIQIASSFSLLIQDPTKGVAAVIFTDCQTKPITDSTNIELSVEQNGQPVQGTTPVDGSMLGSMFAGGFIILNIPAGTTNIGGTYMGHTFLAHDVKVVADSLTETQVRPGY
jgi:hypothetical protein